MVDSEVRFTSLVWSPCGASWPLNLRTQVSLPSLNPKLYGLITDDTVDGNIQYIPGRSGRSVHEHW